MTSVTSDWGDWLVDRIDAADPDGVGIWSLGCNGFVLKDRDGTTLFIDPYFGLGDPPRTVRMIPVPMDPTAVDHADAVLATHEHIDHVDGPSQAPILERTGAPFLGPDDSVETAVEEQGFTTEWDVDRDQLETVAEGDRIEIDGFTVHVEPANDPDATHPVSYVIEHDAGTLVHAGDARPGEPFDTIGREYDIDLGILAFGAEGCIPDGNGACTRTKWYSDADEVSRAANQLQLTRLLPSHWDMWRGMRADPTALHDHVTSYPYPRHLEIAAIGDRVDL